MPINLIDKIAAKAGAFTGLVDAREVIGDGNTNVIPDNAISSSSVLQYVGTATTSAITFTVDPSSTVPALEAGHCFANQTQVDNYLSENNGTAFKLLVDVFDALPPIIGHSITINLVAGIHRPRVGTNYIANLERLIPASGSVIVQGPSDTNVWTVIHAGGTITAHQVGNDDPYVDVAGANFPTDGSLYGRIAVLSNGVKGVIWENTATRLYLTVRLNPAPINGTTTVSIRQPSAIIRASHDDITSSLTTSNTCFTLGNGIGKSGGQINFYNITLHDGNASFGIFSRGGYFRLTDFIYDKLGFTPGGFDNVGGIRFFSNSSVSLTRYSYIATSEYGLVNDHSDGCLDLLAGSRASLFNSYFQGGDSGILVDGNSELYWYDTVARGVGHDTPTVEAWDSIFAANNQNTYFGVMPTIINTNTSRGEAAVSLHQSNMDWSGATSSLTWGLRIGNILDQPAIKLDNSILKMSAGSRLTSYGGGTGGNTGVGIELTGAFSQVQVGTTVTLTGTAGDVKFSDGTIKSYAEIQEAESILDPTFNIVVWS